MIPPADVHPVSSSRCDADGGHKAQSGVWMDDHTDPYQVPLPTPLTSPLFCFAVFSLFHSDGELGRLVNLFTINSITDDL